MILSFKKFNELYNPDNKLVYVPLNNKVPKFKGPLTPVSFEDISQQAKFDPYLEIGWVVPEGTLVLDIDRSEHADLMLSAILEEKPEVLAVKTTRGLHVYCKSDYKKKTTKNYMACGIECDTIPHTSGGTYIVLPFKRAGNKSKNLIEREVVYHNGIGPMTPWMQPLYQSGGKDEPISLPIKANRNDTLNKYLWKMKRSIGSADDREAIIRFINKHFCTESLTETELGATVLREKNNESLEEVVDAGASAKSKKFFNSEGTFMHNWMGDFLIDSMHIKRDVLSKDILFYDEDKKIYRSDMEYIMAEMVLLCPILKNFQRKEVMSYIEHKLVRSAEHFNSDQFKIVFKNGVLDIDTMKLEPMSPEHLESVQLDVNYNPLASSDVVDEFFRTVTDGNKDVERLLYEAIGYSMLKTNELQKAFLLVGEGRNGKSTYLDLIKAILGRANITSVSLKDLAGNFRTSMLVNKLASLAGDISNQPLTESDMFKSIVVGEDVTLERKFKDAFSDSVYATLFFAANNLPRSNDTSFGFYRRFCIIPFNANLDKVSRVEGMQFKRKLCFENSKEYVAYKALKAIEYVLKNTFEFTEPQVVKDMLLKYRITNDNVLSWLYNGIGNDVEEILGRKQEDVYFRYTTWIENNGYKEVKSSKFYDTIMRECGLEVDTYGKFIKKEHH